MTVTSEELKNRVRERLLSDPVWAVYALGDLAPGHFESCRWFLPASAPASVALLYQGFATPILWVAGTAQDFFPFADELLEAPALILQLQPALVEWVAQSHRLTRAKPMLRMGLRPEQFRAEPSHGLLRLGREHLPALEELYLDGEAAGEGPEFFFASMLEEGVFFGAWEDGRLAAVAGTHIFSVEEHASAVGNVYTRRQARGRGLARRLTSAVVEELLRQGVTTIALSVAEENAAARAVYQRLGFETHCRFIEGLARREAGAQ